MKWTTDQQKAIDTRGQNLLISAAAGSGKTAVVTQRAIKLIVEEGVDIESLLMITFTDSAAAEMKIRLGSKLMDEIEKHPEDSRLVNQLDKLNDANISTIHTYCMSVVRRYYQEVNIDPGFSILGNEDSIDYKIRTIHKVLEDYFDKKDKDFLFLCDTLGGRGGRDIADIALQIYVFARSQPNYIDKINKWTNNFDLNEDDLAKSEWIAYILDDMQNDIDDALYLNKHILDLANKDGGPSSYVEAFTSDKFYLESIQQALQTKDIAAINKVITPNGFVKLKRKSKEDDEQIVNQCKNLRDKIKAINKGFTSSLIMQPISELNNRHKAMYPALSTLRDIILDFDKEYTKLKSRRRQLDFDDLQHLALKALSNEAVAKSESGRFKHIFVDEYQDTNQLQESLIEQIAGKKNLLCVGDVKQSIYAFRQADPALFLNRRNKYKDEKASDDLICLNQNFRSAPSIINTINLVFESIMSERLGDIDYDADEMLYHGAPRPTIEQNEGVDFVIINYEDSNGEENDQIVEKEAMAAANYIQTLIGKPIWDGKADKMRPTEYKDICILSKSFKPSARTVRSILEQQGIPVVQNESGKYFDEVEVGQLIDILTVIDNKRRDTALISAMMSPAFGFDIEELLAIRKETDGRVPFYQCVIDYTAEDNAIGIKTAAFLSDLARYKDIARYTDLSEFIWQVLDETGLYNAVGALPGGAIRQSNLRLLLQRASNYSKQPASTLSGFLSYIKRLHKSEVSIDADNLSADNSVQFMSIHKSKGLEFPIVIIINANKQPTMSSLTNQITTYKYLGYGCQSFNPSERTKKKTIAGEAIGKAITNSIYSEDMRVFYVALTRARERLVVIGSTKSKQTIKSLATSWSEPFIPANYGRTNATLFNYMGIAAVKNTACGSLIAVSDIQVKNKVLLDNFNVNIINAQDIKIDRVRRVGAVADAIRKCSNIKNPPKFLWEYKDNIEPIPQKTTATRLLSAADISKHDMPNFSTVPNLEDNIAEITPTVRGAVTHKFLQLVDWNNDDLNAQINTLVKRGLLPQNADKIINFTTVDNFLNSSILSRIKQSDKIYRELPFVVKEKYSEIDPLSNNNQEILIQGIIDLCFLEDDKWVLIDYKTNRLSSKQTEKDIINHYRIQLDIYSKALESISNIPVKQSGIYLLSASKMLWL